TRHGAYPRKLWWLPTSSARHLPSLQRLWSLANYLGALGRVYRPRAATHCIVVFTFFRMNGQDGLTICDEYFITDIYKVALLPARLLCRVPTPITRSPVAATTRTCAGSA